MVGSGFMTFIGRGGRKPTSTKFLVQVMSLFVGVMLLMNFAANYRPTAPTPPSPSPGVSKTVPGP